MEHSHDHKTCCELGVPRYNVCQTLDEISFLNGIWTADDLENARVILIQSDQEGLIPEIESPLCATRFRSLNFIRETLEGNASRVQGLLQKGVLVNALDSAGYTALHYAARAGEVRVCEILLEHGADVNARTGNLRATALHRAVCPPIIHKSHVEVVDLLLRHGAEPNMTDVDGRTALHRLIYILARNFVEGVKIVKKLLPITDHAIRDNDGQNVDNEFERWMTIESDTKQTDIENIETIKKMLVYWRVTRENR